VDIGGRDRGRDSSDKDGADQEEDERQQSGARSRKHAGTSAKRRYLRPSGGAGAPSSLSTPAGNSEGERIPSASTALHAEQLSPERLSAEDSSALSLARGGGASQHHHARQDEQDALVQPRQPLSPPQTEALPLVASRKRASDAEGGDHKVDPHHVREKDKRPRLLERPLIALDRRRRPLLKAENGGSGGVSPEREDEEEDDDEIDDHEGNVGGRTSSAESSPSRPLSPSALASLYTRALASLPSSLSHHAGTSSKSMATAQRGGVVNGLMGMLPTAPVEAASAGATYPQTAAVGKIMSQTSALANGGGDKPFACEFCDARFARASHLCRHRRTHTGEKPFECKRCGKQFSRQDKLKTHNDRHITRDGGTPVVVPRKKRKGSVEDQLAQLQTTLQPQKNSFSIQLPQQPLQIHQVQAQQSAPQPTQRPLPTVSSEMASVVLNAASSWSNVAFPGLAAPIFQQQQQQQQQQQSLVALNPQQLSPDPPAPQAQPVFDQAHINLSPVPSIATSVQAAAPSGATFAQLQNVNISSLVSSAIQAAAAAVQM